MTTSSSSTRESKNAAAFAPPGSAAAQQLTELSTQQIPVQSTTQMVQQSLGFELEVADVPMPSLGKVYGDAPLANAEFVSIRSMTARDEDILMNRTLARKGTIITELIKSCVMDKSIDINSMIAGDRHALMIAVRITGYTKNYTPKIVCPSCEAQHEHNIDLENLPVKELDLSKVEQVSPNTNLFKFVLPATKKTVGFKFLTGREEEQMLVDAEARRKRGILSENIVTTRLMSSIVDIDGNTDRSFINRFCQNMPARDSLALRTHLSAVEPGIDMTFEYQCQSCGHQEVMSVPLGTEFFWPSAAR